MSVWTFFRLAETRQLPISQHLAEVIPQCYFELITGVNSSIAF